MENFTKGEVKELEDPYPFSVDEALQMRITQGSKIRNVMGFAMKKMAEKEVRQIAWNGSGTSVTKTITCAEIMKRKLKVLHQITKIRFKRIEEYWMPTIEGLEPLKVKRDVPAISILLSKDPLDATEAGYQPPGNFEAFWQDKKNADKSGKSRPRSARKSRGQPVHPKKVKTSQSASNVSEGKAEETSPSVDSSSKET